MPPIIPYRDCRKASAGEACLPNNPTMGRRQFLATIGTAAGALLGTGCGEVSEEPKNFDRFYQNISVGNAHRVASNVNSFHFPHFQVIEEDPEKRINAYFIDHSGGDPNNTGLATTINGRDFLYYGKVLRKGPEWFDERQASFPAVQYYQDYWHMLYEGKGPHDINAVNLAVSEDGIVWEKRGPVIRPDGYDYNLMTDAPTPGRLADVDVGTPTFFNENGIWHVYYHMHSSDSKVRIGYASGVDLKKLNVKTAALIDVDTSGFEIGTVGARTNIIRRGNLYYMAYEACDSIDFERARWGTSIARSLYPDRGWQKWAGNPLIVNPDLGFGYDGPEFLELDGRLWLYFRQNRYNPNETYRVEVFGL